MRVGICARTWSEPGGIGVYTRNVLQNLFELDNENDYVVFYSEAEFQGQFTDRANVTEEFIPIRGKIVGSQLATLFWDQVSIPMAAKRHRLDIVMHTKMAVPLMTRCTTVMLVHGTERFFYPEHHHKSDVWFFKSVYKLFLRRADLIIADAENARKDLIEQAAVDGSKIEVVHLAGDEAFCVIDDKDRLRQVRQKYQLPEKYLIFVGHIYPGKNIGRLLQALSIVRQEVDVDLVLVGGVRRQFQQDLALIDELGLKDHVHRTGFVPLDDLVPLYNLAEATVFPSLYECFPAIPLDANACACPVVTSNTGGTPESAGDAAEYVDPFDVADIARGTLRVLTDEERRNELVMKGFDNAARFSWARTARRTLEVLHAANSRK